MEIISLPGYTEDEKVEIAKRYLLSRQLEAHGLTPEQAHVNEAALHTIVSDYTREAGCRNLEREIAAVLRNAAIQIAEGKTERVAITPLSCLQSLAHNALKAKSQCVPASPAWQPAWHGHRLAAIFCSSKPPKCRGMAS
ncbi:hypothetical protein [Thiothrix subterranea]|uniref:hypothetical protein n=1 Tax=Thiothrix subterranea TaxID=2735563 RepID=UPI00280A930F|nr:hypothetical protein [Thiothrix subterranea]